MKKLVILFAAATFIVSCGNSNNNADNTGTDAAGTEAAGNTAAGTTSADTAATANAGAASESDLDKGLNLIASSDCLTCHKVDEKLVGPSYREVAQKYASLPNAVDSLAHKIVHGGAGNWGQVPMTPHPNLSLDDAKVMVHYILSLK